MNTDAATLTAEGHDFWGFGGTPGLVLRPCTREEVLAVVRIAAEHHTPLVTRGGASSSGAIMPNPQRGLVASGRSPRPSSKSSSTHRDQCRKDITRKEWRCDRLSGPQAL